MPRLPAVSGIEAVRALGKAGFILIRQAGSHMVLQRRDAHGTTTVVVPRHSGLAKGTLRAMLRKAGLSVEDFQDLL